MKFLTNLAVLFFGMTSGVALLATAGSLVPTLFINLGLYSTLLAIIVTLGLTIPWLYRKSDTTRITQLSVVRLLGYTFIVTALIVGCVTMALNIFSPTTAELMTWGEKIVIANGQKTAEGWALDFRGCHEGGFAGLILSSAVVASSKAMDWFRTWYQNQGDIRS